MPLPLLHLFESSGRFDAQPAAPKSPEQAAPFESTLRQREFSAPPRLAHASGPRTIRDYLANPIPALGPPVQMSSKYARASRQHASSPLPSSSSPEIANAIREASAKYHVPEPLIHAVVRNESAYKTNAVSPAGAQGLMQLMPGTAKELGVRNAFDVRDNIDGGTRYLRQMLDQFGEVRLAVAAYNAGPGAVRKYNNAIPAYRETQNYVARVMKDFQTLQKRV